ncbi:MAG: iron-sulfur cluster assembly accessory protein [Chlamydiota bacterium]
MSQKKDVSTQETVVTVTKKAAEKFREILLEQNRQGAALRIAEIPGGCAGFREELDFSDAPLPTDVVTHSCGIEIHIHENQVSRFRGSVVDYVEDLKDPGFKVHNPNPRSHCGCGSSYRYE